MRGLSGRYSSVFNNGSYQKHIQTSSKASQDFKSLNEVSSIQSMNIYKHGLELNLNEGNFKSNLYVDMLVFL